MISYEDFKKVKMCVGTVLKAEFFPEARIPAIKMHIDFGEEIGIKQTSAQITQRYTPAEMVGRQVVAVVNFPPKKVAGFKSEVLILGGVPSEGDVVLLSPDVKIPNGTEIA